MRCLIALSSEEGHVRKFLTIVLIVSALAMATAMPAAARVHGVTPLNCTPANETSGACQTFNTPADSANGGPLQPGVIPIGTGNSPLQPGDGGRNAAVCNLE
jgi:hypothetical protein